jgi:hypothetical protein
MVASPKWSVPGIPTAGKLAGWRVTRLYAPSATQAEHLASFNQWRLLSANHSSRTTPDCAAVLLGDGGESPTLTTLAAAVDGGLPRPDGIVRASELAAATAVASIAGAAGVGAAVGLAAGVALGFLCVGFGDCSRAW